MVKLNRDRIRTALSTSEKRWSRHYQDILPEEKFGRLRQAAVLMPLFEKDNRWHLLLTHRSESLKTHRDQVAFPGGAREPSDVDLRWTALREMNEEIGVNPKDVTVFGDLGEMPIVTGYCVRPFVGEIPWPYPFKLSGDEVKDVFMIPLDWLIDLDHRTVCYRNYAGRELPVIYFDDFEGHQLWGASAEMTIALLKALDLV